MQASVFPLHVVPSSILQAPHSAPAGVSLYQQDAFCRWEIAAVTETGMFMRWEQWAEALSMVPGSEFYQCLYDDLPSSFQTTARKSLAAREARAARRKAETWRTFNPKQKAT